jgi:hypothetical protein
MICNVRHIERRKTVMKRKLSKVLDMYASIHTVEICSKQIPVLDELDKGAVKLRPSYNWNTGEITNYMVVNPHNYDGDELLLYCYFEDTMRDLTEKMKLSDWKYNRVDIRLDSYDDNYQAYFKLNALLIGLLNMKCNFKGGEPVISTGLMTRLKCSVFVKNDQWAIEYYDKKKESQDRFPCKARLEFRMKRLSGKTPLEVMELLFRRLEKLDSYYKEWLEKLNKCLYAHYCATNEHLLTKIGKCNVTAFVKKHEEVFYSRKQISDFCKMCGVEKFEGRANDIVRRTGMELISQKDIREYIASIKRLITEYIDE